MSSTPTLAVHDNRGAAVRTIQYNRRRSTDATQTLITHNQLPDGALEAQQRDPRLFTVWQSGSQAANLVTRSSLAGQGLRRESSDSGSEVTLFDAEGRAVWQQDARGTVTQVSYDRLGRPVSCQQQVSGGTARTAQVYFYGDANGGSSTESLRGDNLLGQCLRRYDEGGAQFTDSVALSGAVLRSSSQLPVSAEQEGNWQGSESSWQSQLDPTVYVTTVTAGAAGQVLTQTDAAGHVTTLGYDAGGLQVNSSLTLSDGTHIALLNGLTYSAAGQPLSETAGNGVVTTYGYQPQTQRLSDLSAVRSTDKVQLQGLGYTYDAVGNVMMVTDNTVSAGYFRNQATDGSCSFTYDALYQLVTATGRENAGKAAQSGDLPSPVTPVPANDAKYQAYTRAYSYDASGNLSSLTHSGSGQGYSLDMVTESTSNRSVQQNTAKSVTPGTVKNYFDAAGNLQSLQAKASPATANGLTWDEDNRLRAVVLLSRSTTDMSQNDREVYQYRDGMRVRKQMRRLTNSESGLWTVDEVRYLGGVELRSTYQETVKAGVSTPGAVSEALEVVTAQAGRSQIRVLHWTAGRPSTVANNQARYSVDDHTGSLMLELDGTGQIISREEYYPYGGTAVWAVRSEVEAAYKTVRYSGKERDGTGLYYYGYRYYAPWLCRWLNADPAREVDGLNLYRMVRNNPVVFKDNDGLIPLLKDALYYAGYANIAPITQMRKLRAQDEEKYQNAKTKYIKEYIYPKFAHGSMDDAYFYWDISVDALDKKLSRSAFQDAMHQTLAPKTIPKPVHVPTPEEIEEKRKYAWRRFKDVYSTNAAYPEIKRALATKTAANVIPEKVTAELRRRHGQDIFDDTGGKSAKLYIKSEAAHLSAKYLIDTDKEFYNESKTEVNTYFRGQRITKDKFDTYQVGDIYSSRTFMSVSDRESVAEGFALHGGSTTQPFKIKITGFSAEGMSSEYSVRGESESVFSTHATFEVKELKADGGMFYMHLNELRSYTGPTAKRLH